MSVVASVMSDTARPRRSSNATASAVKLTAIQGGISAHGAVDRSSGSRSLAEAVRAVDQGASPKAAAMEMWSRTTYDLLFARAVMSFATMNDEELLNYEAGGQHVHVRGRWGEFWLCPVSRYWEDDGIPWFTARQLRTIALGMVDALIEGPPTSSTLISSGDDFGL